jgi:hypothetical protein
MAMSKKDGYRSNVSGNADAACDLHKHLLSKIETVLVSGS